MLHVPIRVLTEVQTWQVGDTSICYKMMVTRMKNIATVDLGVKLPKTLTCLWINLDELAVIVAATLNRRHTYTPLLKPLKLLVSQVPHIVWDQWDPDMISNALGARDSGPGVDVSIDTVLYRCFPVSLLVSTGSYPLF
ncbi:unnamed protein product, partial [Aureobasidium vineae]